MKMLTLSDEQKKQYLELALRNGKKLSHLVEELFEFSTLDAGDRPVRMEAFSLSDLLQDVVQKFELRAHAAGIRLQTSLTQGAPLVQGDVALIERLLDNLIDNAIKHTPRDGTIMIALVPLSDRVAVEVRDSGIGIDREHLPHIFEPFYRIGRGEGDKLDGVGLGLAIASRIAQLHNSKIEVESIPGKVRYSGLI